MSRQEVKGSEMSDHLSGPDGGFQTCQWDAGRHGVEDKALLPRSFTKVRPFCFVSSVPTDLMTGRLKFLTLEHERALLIKF